jgi:hypothetical protein
MLTIDQTNWTVTAADPVGEDPDVNPGSLGVCWTAPTQSGVRKQSLPQRGIAAGVCDCELQLFVGADPGEAAAFLAWHRGVAGVRARRPAASTALEAWSRGTTNKADSPPAEAKTALDIDEIDRLASVCGLEPDREEFFSARVDWLVDVELDEVLHHVLLNSAVRWE